MKIKVLVEQEIDVKTLEIRCPFDEDDEVPESMVVNGFFDVKIDIDSKKILFADQYASDLPCNVHICAKDRGYYKLINANGDIASRIDSDYVPNGIVPGEYGDYIELSIDMDGVITNWPKSPSLADFKFERCNL
jgi:hypothetical protein